MDYPFRETQWLLRVPSERRPLGQLLASVRHEVCEHQRKFHQHSPPEISLHSSPSDAFRDSSGGIRLSDLTADQLSQYHLALLAGCASHLPELPSVRLNTSSFSQRP